MSILLGQIQRAKHSGERPPEPSLREMLILKHALESFARFGYSGTNLRAVAGAAGMTAPMVNYYFKSKESLYQRLAAITMQTLDREIDDATPAQGGFKETLRGVLHGHAAFAEKYPDGLRLLLGMVYGPSQDLPDVDLVPLYAGVQQRIRRSFERALRTKQLVLRAGLSRSDAIDLFSEGVDAAVLRIFKAQRYDTSPPSSQDLDRRLERLLLFIGRKDA